MSARPRNIPTTIVADINRLAARDRLRNEDLAALFGVDQSTVSRWRVLKRGPSNMLVRKNVLRVLAKKLGTIVVATERA